VGRRNLIRRAALVAVLLWVSAASAADTQKPWSLQGTTVPNGSQAPRAYLAARRVALQPWLRRLTTTHRARVRAVDFTKTFLFAGFLDGQSCVFDVRLVGWTHIGSKLTVDVSYRRPPIGVATCVRTSVSYVVLGFNRTGFGRLPASVELRAHARA
jgi:hypothetical protein